MGARIVMSVKRKFRLDDGFSHTRSTDVFFGKEIKKRGGEGRGRFIELDREIGHKKESESVPELMEQEARCHREGERGGGESKKQCAVRGTFIQYSRCLQWLVCACGELEAQGIRAPGEVTVLTGLPFSPFPRFINSS